MKLFTVKINNIEIYTTKASSKFNAFSLINQHLPELLSYPHYWCIAHHPNEIPITIPEKIVFYSKPYQYYMIYKNDPDRADKIELEKGYYFYGKNIVECIKDINYLVTASDSDSSDNDNDNDNDNFDDKKNRKILRRKIKLKNNKIRLMGGILKKKKIKRKKKEKIVIHSDLDSCSESESEPEDENIFIKYITHYVKKHMTFDIFNKIINFSAEKNDIRCHDTIEFIVSPIFENKFKDKETVCVNCSIL